MLADLLALLDKPVVLLIVLTIGGVIGIALESALNRIDRERRRAYWRGKNSAKGKFGKAAPSPRDAAPIDAAADQLKAVMRADFKSRALLNKPEGQVFRALDKIVIARNPRWQVMAQVSLGEFLGCEDREAYGCINSKRVDFALMDEACRVRHALEYQGGRPPPGHRRRARRGQEGSAAQGGDRVSRGGRGAHDACEVEAAGGEVGAGAAALGICNRAASSRSISPSNGSANASP